MAITNYTELTQSLVAWLDIATADVSSVVSNLVTVGELRIMRELRTPHMETALAATIASGSISVPSNLAELKYAYIDTNPVRYIQLVPASYIYERYPTRAADGVPLVMARDGANYIFGPYPDSDYLVKGTFYKHLTLSQSGATAHALFTANPDAYLWGCLAESEPLIGRDSRIPLWEAKYQMVKQLVNGEADRSRFGGNLQIRPG